MRHLTRRSQEQRHRWAGASWRAHAVKNRIQNTEDAGAVLGRKQHGCLSFGIVWIEDLRPRLGALCFYRSIIVSQPGRTTVADGTTGIFCGENAPRTPADF